MATVARRIVTAVPSIGINGTKATREYAKEPVAAYARVSTEKEEQEDSFERQVEHYTSKRCNRCSMAPKKSSK